MAEYKVGDIVWYFKGELLVRCTVVELDDQWRKKYGKDGVLYYVIDEPVGHSVSDFEITPDFEEAVAAFKEDHEEILAARKEEGITSPLEPSPTLQQTREETCKFIASTHLVGNSYGNLKQVPQEWVDELMKKWPPKEHNRDWFGWEDLCV